MGLLIVLYLCKYVCTYVRMCVCRYVRIRLHDNEVQEGSVAVSDRT
jgi:hypothetical protein